MPNYERPSWDEYFMGVAKLAAMRSKDPSTQVGAILVKDNRLISMGYNGMPHGVDLSWNKNSGLDNKYFYVCHAELNAITNVRGFNNIEGSTIYVTLFPCNECAKLLIQCGIKKVVYLSDKYADKEPFKASRLLLESAGIELKQFVEREAFISLENIQ